MQLHITGKIIKCGKFRPLQINIVSRTDHKLTYRPYPEERPAQEIEY